VFTQQKFGDKDVNFTQAISAGLFVVKRGGQLREIDTTTFKTHAFPFQIPGKADVIMKNIGNVHLTPRASVLVYDWRKTLVAKGIANNQSRRVLPGKEFQDTFKIVQSKKLWLPQKLKVVFEYRADSIEEAKYVTSTQLYIPPYLFVIVAVALIGAAVIGKRKLKKRKQRRAKQRVIATEAVDHQPPADDPQKDVAEPVEIPDAGPEVFTKKHSKKRRNISVSSLEP
jgi:hypothetical protein